MFLKIWLQATPKPSKMLPLDLDFIADFLKIEKKRECVFQTEYF